MAVKKTNVKQHPRKTKKGRTKVRRHDRNLKSKKLDAKMVRSIQGLQGGPREYGTGMDFDKIKDKEYISSISNIYRGKTGKENASGRASTSVPDGTDVTVHTHPTRKDKAENRWWSSGPSGTDIALMIIRTADKGLDEAYIVGTEGTWTRYRLVGTEKQKIKIYHKLQGYTVKGFDKMVEENRQHSLNVESNNRMLNSRDRNRYWELSDKGISKRTREESIMFRGLKNKSDNLRNEASAKAFKKKHDLAYRRGYYRHNEVMLRDWRVEIKKVKKDKKGDLRMHYKED